MKRFFLKKLKGLLILLLTLFFFVFVSPLNYSQESEAPVLLGSQTVFVLHNGVGSFSVQERAKAVSERIAILADDPRFQAESLKVEAKPELIKILAGERVILTLTAADAQLASQTQPALASEYRQKIIAAIKQHREQLPRDNLIKSFTSLAAATGFFIFLIIILNWIFPKIYALIEAWGQTRTSGVRVDEIGNLLFTRIAKILISILRFLQLTIFLIVLAIYTTFTLSRFSWTARLARAIKRDFFANLTHIGLSFLDSIPNLLIIALGIFISYHVIHLVNSIFKAIERRNVSLPGFYPEWAETSSKIVVFLIIGFTLALIFPLLPGYKSNAFKGISIFLGLLVSLGSSGVVANFLAGIMLTYTRAFKIEDFVRIDDATGRIVDRTLLFTRIRTIKNEIITLNNTQVLNNQIINYSASAREHAAYLNLHTTITLGYDVPLEDVHQALISAALATSYILKEPAPFVWQTSLDDFYVSYQLNAYTERPSLMYEIYSELNGNILQKCEQAGIEILSPHYAALRDGNESTLSPEHLPPNSTTPGFRISPLNPNQNDQSQKS